jgi:uncharacterized protein
MQRCAKPASAAASRALGERERQRLEALLDALQPRPVPASRWLAHVHDLDGRPAPSGVALAPLHELVLRRHAELERAIEARQWFDPWVYDLEPAAPGADLAPADVVLPWVAGFAAAMDLFPGLLERAGDAEALEALATLYAHFDPEDLEDADELLAVIETLEAPASVAEAVEDLVRCSLLLADVTRPRRRGAGH